MPPSPCSFFACMRRNKMERFSSFRFERQTFAVKLTNTKTNTHNCKTPARQAALQLQLQLQLQTETEIPIPMLIRIRIVEPPKATARMQIAFLEGCIEGEGSRIYTCRLFTDRKCNSQIVSSAQTQIECEPSEDFCEAVWRLPSLAKACSLSTWSTHVCACVCVWGMLCLSPKPAGKL